MIKVGLAFDRKHILTELFVCLGMSKCTLGSFTNPSYHNNAGKGQNEISKFLLKTIFWADWQRRCEFYTLVKSIKFGSEGVGCRLSSTLSDHRIYFEVKKILQIHLTINNSRIL